MLLPFDWLLMSAASYRALFHLMWRPHHWEKTPHGRDGVAAVPSRQLSQAPPRLAQRSMK
jgi:hypothetical protein